MTMTWILNECTPNAAQTKLLQAATCQDKRAQTAWKAWCQLVDLDDVDGASYRLLPMVYRNLTAQGVHDPTLMRLKGVYRYTWYKNQMLFHHAEQVVALLRSADIPIMLLKGAALSLQHYDDNGIRHMNDVDIMIPHKQFNHAFQLLLKQGWHTKLPLEKAQWYTDHLFIHACGFRKDDFELDLHHHLINSVWQSPEMYWHDAIPITWRGHEVVVLNDTDHLFVTCVKGLQWSHAYLSWIPDALVILKHEKATIQWDKLLNHAKHTRTQLYLRHAFAYLVDQFDAPIPADVLHQLDSMNTTFVEQQEYKALGRAPKNLAQLAHHGLFCGSRYKAFRKSDPSPLRFSVLGWKQYLYMRWQVAHWQQLPSNLVRIWKKEAAGV